MSLQARITALAQAIGADVKAMASKYMPRTPFGGSVDKTRLMENAQMGAVDAFVSVDGAGADWPAQSLSVSWWNIFTFGAQARTSQIALQAFDTRRLQFWFRHRHDSTWQPWARLPATYAETGFLIQDGGLLGYGAGVGGTATQTGSKSDSVVLNKPCGVITLHDETIAGGGSFRFNIQNSLVGPNDIVILHPIYPDANPMEWVFRWAVGASIIRVHGINALTTPQGGNLKIVFAIIKGSTA